MNISPINGSALNIEGYLGNDWLGTGGIDPASYAFSASLLTDIRLQGGISAQAFLIGSIGTSLRGGVYSFFHTLGAEWFIEPRISSGMRVTNILGGIPAVSAKLSRGFSNYHTVGGDWQLSVIMQALNSRMSSNASLNSAPTFLFGRVLSNGINSSNLISSSILLGAVSKTVLANGVMSSIKLGGLNTIVNTGRLLRGGFTSTSDLSSLYRYDALFQHAKISSYGQLSGHYKIDYLTGPLGFTGMTSLGGNQLIGIGLNSGCVSYSQMGGFYIISATESLGISVSGLFGSKLQISLILRSLDLLWSSDDLDAHGLLISSGLNDGISNIGDLGGKFIIFSTVFGGADSSDDIGALLNISAMLSGGVDSVAFFNNTHAARISAILLGGFGTSSMVLESRDLRIGIDLTGGIEKYGMYGGACTLSAYLSGGSAYDQMFKSSILISPMLSGGLSYVGLFNSGFLIDAHLSNGFTKAQSFDGLICIGSRLQHGIDVSDSFNAKWKIDCMLMSGQISSSIVRGAIGSSFEDPHLNTWAIYLKSATQQLSLITPKQDT